MKSTAAVCCLVMVVFLGATGCSDPLPVGFEIQGKWKGEQENSACTYEFTSDGMANAFMFRNGQATLGGFLFEQEGTSNPFRLKLSNVFGDIGVVTVKVVSADEMEFDQTYNAQTQKLEPVSLRLHKQ